MSSIECQIRRGDIFVRIIENVSLVFILTPIGAHVTDIILKRLMINVSIENAFVSVSNWYIVLYYIR